MRGFEQMQERLRGRQNRLMIESFCSQLLLDLSPKVYYLAHFEALSKVLNLLGLSFHISKMGMTTECRGSL